MPIRAVTIDFWGTLFHDPPTFGDRHKARRLADFDAILTRAGARVSARDLDRAYEASGAVLREVWMRHRDLPVAEHVAAILEALGAGLAARLPAEARQALAHAYARPALLAPPVVAAGAAEALRALAARGLTLCVVSNAMRTPGATLRELLRRHGLLDHFAHTTFSDEVGVRKPDPAIFRLTLDAVGARPDEAVHVGDDPVLDVVGARAAGLRVIQLVDPGAPPAGGPIPDVAIAGLAGVPDAVAQLAGER